MTYSLNEISSLMLKAARGSGLPMGLAEDCAAAGTWLICHGQDGAAAVWEGLVSRGVIWKGPSLLDQVIARGIDNPQTVQIMDAPLLFLGMAGVVSAQTGTQIRIEFLNGCHAVLDPDGMTVTGILSGGVDAVVTMVRGSGAPPGIHPPRTTRVDISPALIRSLTERAALTYVPATAESRQRGAGAGLTDND